LVLVVAGVVGLILPEVMVVFLLLLVLPLRKILVVLERILLRLTVVVAAAVLTILLVEMAVLVVVEMVLSPEDQEIHLAPLHLREVMAVMEMITLHTTGAVVVVLVVQAAMLGLTVVLAA
jgi:hypothetical protein